MIIRSIRLKNIKSYGDGPNSDGVTIEFQPGINRIAGKNGHGKSTLIESLGYALFLTNPVFEENFDVATYLLRSGKKAGEIDVTFDHEGQLYRLERGLGTQNKRRAKAILLNDGSTEAEGDKELSAFLCRLFGFPLEGRCSELFSKLIGVRQGRLTLPFDSKSADARRHFEPLLDVEIFRLCFDKLKPAVDRFDDLKRNQEDLRVAATERIEERKNSPEQLKRVQQEADGLEKMVAQARKTKETAEQQRQAQETKEKAFQTAQKELDAVTNALQLASQKKEHDQQRLDDSKRARAIAAANQSAHETYTRAEAALARLQQQQTEKSRLERLLAEQSNLKTEWQGKADAARQQARTFAGQKAEKSGVAGQLRAQILDEENALARTKATFDDFAAATTAARDAHSVLNRWLEDSSRAIADNKARLAASLAQGTELAGWDPQSVTRARSAEANAARTVQDLTAQLGAAQELKRNLSLQLEEISGGVCPFLKEQCRQFNPEKVQADIGDKQWAIEELSLKHQAASAAHNLARATLDSWSQEEARLTQVRKALSAGIEDFINQHNALFPPRAQQALALIRRHVPSDTQQRPLQPLAQVAAAACFDPSGTTFQFKMLQETVAAEDQFHEQASDLLREISSAARARFDEFDKQRDARLARERDLKNLRNNLRNSEQEATALGDKADEQNQKADDFYREAAKAATRIAELEVLLKTFDRIGEELRAQQELKQRHSTGHQLYLGAKPTADLLAEREAALAKSSEAEAFATRRLEQRKDAWSRARQEFDPAALDAARKNCEEAGAELAAVSVRLENVGRDLANEQRRFSEWQAASAVRERLELEIGKLQAAIDLTQKARQVLQKTAPLVAQHICRRIAGRAQQIFNQVSHEPVELEWIADRYSLRINPGERRFAMLSGGEQTKLALAMTLAMILELCGLKFCVFDEPTYGVDAESRPKLADAIIEVQKAAAFDQLLLVSHDDAFEGKIDNVVLLKKSSLTGTAVASV